jgi:hypothetical protein
MKSTSVALALWGGIALAGCEGVHYANLFTLGVTVCLFFGTLNLGRRTSTTRPESERAPQAAPHHTK